MKSLLDRIPGVRAVSRLLGVVPQDGRDFVLEIFPGDSVGVEIGVHLGDFSKRILKKVRPRKLYLIDPWRYEDSEVYENAWYGGAAKGEQLEMDERFEGVLKLFNSEIKSGQVEVYRGFSADVGRIFKNDCLDWVYIDGNHLYDFVKKDLEIYYHKLKVGGYLTGDDYSETGWWGGDVRKAVDEFVRSKAIEVIEMKNNQFIFKKC